MGEACRCARLLFGAVTVVTSRATATSSSGALPARLVARQAQRPCEHIQPFAVSTRFSTLAE
jgi:hypothetical protein